MRRAVGALTVGLLAACGGQDLGPPRYTLEDCAVRRLADAETGWSVAGAEDLARLADGRIVLSAYDRLAAEAALKDRGQPPNGGLYAIQPDALAEGDLTVGSIAAAGPSGGLRPHGIDARGDRIAVVNRSGGDGLAPILEIYEVRDEGAKLIRSIDTAAYCAANDIAILDGGPLLISLDRAKCPGWAFDERVFGARKARLVRHGLDDKTTTLAGGLFFANGVARLGDDVLAVAETRAKQVRIIDGDGAGAKLKTPGAPDNLTRAPDGRLVVALQPDLIAFARYRYGRRDRAPSRIIALDPATGATELLFEDRSGDLFSGATVGLLTSDLLIAGSIRDNGLLVCREGGL